MKSIRSMRCVQTCECIYKQNLMDQQYWLTCVLEPPVLTNCTWRLEIRPVMEEHLNSRRLYLGWSIRYYIQKVLKQYKNHFERQCPTWKYSQKIIGSKNTTFHTSCLYFIRHSKSWQWYTNISITTADQLMFIFLLLFND